MQRQFQPDPAGIIELLSTKESREFSLKFTTASVQDYLERGLTSRLFLRQLYDAYQFKDREFSYFDLEVINRAAKSLGKDFYRYFVEDCRIRTKESSPYTPNGRIMSSGAYIGQKFIALNGRIDITRISLEHELRFFPSGAAKEQIKNVEHFTKFAKLLANPGIRVGFANPEVLNTLRQTKENIEKLEEIRKAARKDTRNFSAAQRAEHRTNVDSDYWRTEELSRETIWNLVKLFSHRKGINFSQRDYTSLRDFYYGNAKVLSKATLMLLPEQVLHARNTGFFDIEEKEENRLKKLADIVKKAEKSKGIRQIWHTTKFAFKQSRNPKPERKMRG